MIKLFSCNCYRYNEILFIIDTCQAASMYEHFYSPNILAIASSRVGEDSLSVSFDLSCFFMFLSYAPPNTYYRKSAAVAN